MKKFLLSNLSFFCFTWWDGDNNVNTETFVTNAPKQVIEDAIREIKTENPDEFCYHDIVERIEDKGFKIEAIDIEEFEI